MPVPSTRAAGRSSPPTGQTSACPTSNTAPPRSTSPVSKSTPIIKAAASVPRLISALIGEAGQKGQDLVLDVLTVSRRAQGLYQRLGMAEVARHGDNKIKITMRSARPRR